MAGPYTSRVAVKRIKPNILAQHFDESRVFYNDVIGLDGGDCPIGVASTVVDMSSGSPIVLRQGSADITSTYI